ncbi:MAG TPA: alpha/beta hydrolase [Candidatus Bathyarchaeia archaeon]|nr:alpha/beta hydrolase [Candidatus Bathyarchaeia archaeon]
MNETTVATSEGRFTVATAGPADGPLVLLLHGYPQTRHSWRAQVPALGSAGYHAVAPDQRGYSPGVRPDPIAGLGAYAIERLVQDVLDIADAAGGAGRPFHLVGHDWGGQVAWVTAHRHPDRLRSLTVLSRPHPAAFRRAFRENADDQQHRSRHHRLFHEPTTGPKLLEDGARRLRSGLAEHGVGDAAIAEYLSVLGEPDALEAALAWYRAAGSLTAVPVGPIAVPTLYVWGDADATVGPSAVRYTAEFVTAPYRLEILPGIGHFVTDEAPEDATRVLRSHLDAQR